IGISWDIGRASFSGRNRDKVHDAVAYLVVWGLEHRVPGEIRATETERSGALQASERSRLSAQGRLPPTRVRLFGHVETLVGCRHSRTDRTTDHALKAGLRRLISLGLTVVISRKGAGLPSRREMSTGSVMLVARELAPYALGALATTFMVLSSQYRTPP